MFFGLSNLPVLSNVSSPSSIYNGKNPSTWFAGGVVVTIPLASTNKSFPAASVACTKLKIFGTLPTPNGTSESPNLDIPLTLIVESGPVVPVVKVKLFEVGLYLTVTPPVCCPVIGSSIWLIRD